MKYLLFPGAVALALASASPAFALAGTAPLPHKEIGIRNAVNISSGLLAWVAEDIAIGPENAPSSLKLARMHNPYSDSTTSHLAGKFGADTSHNYELNIRCEAGYCSLMPGTDVDAVVVYDHKSYSFAGTVPPNGKLVSALADGSYITRLTDTDGKIYLAFVAADGTRVLFGQTGVTYNHTVGGIDASLILHPNGERTKITYQLVGQTPSQAYPQGRVSTVENSRGYGLRFSYVRTGGTVGSQHYLISRVDSYQRPCAGCASTDVASATYGYFYKTLPNGAGAYLLSSVTDPTGASQTYTAAASDFALTAVTSTSGRAQISNVSYYHGVGFVYLTGSVADGAGKVTQFREKTVPVSTPPYAAMIGREVVNPDGKVETYLFDRPSLAEQQARYSELSHPWPYNPYGIGTVDRVKSYTDALGRTFVNKLDYFQRVAGQTNPEGDSISYKLDERGNAVETVQIPKPGSPLPAAKTTVVFPACTLTNFKSCNRGTSLVDPKGWRTNYVWSDLHGGLVSQTSGLDAAGNCTFAGGCPGKSYEYSAFTGVDGATFYLPTAEIEQISGGASTRTSYSYDPAAGFTLRQVVADVGGLNLTSCLKYDSAGNLLRKDEPKAGAVTCS
ncbi:MAG TPA: hypothetical protein VF680_17985 [Allosphingosinicella sp.]|jgi:hypothetical protein